MPPKCIGLCDREKGRKRNPYSNGFKRCTTCVKFIETDELRCYCCSIKLRKYSHKGKCKKKMLEVVARY